MAEWISTKVVLILSSLTFWISLLHLVHHIFKYSTSYIDWLSLQSIINHLDSNLHSSLYYFPSKVESITIMTYWSRLLSAYLEYPIDLITMIYSQFHFLIDWVNCFPPLSLYLSNSNLNHSSLSSIHPLYSYRPFINMSIVISIDLYNSDCLNSHPIHSEPSYSIYDSKVS